MPWRYTTPLDLVDHWQTLIAGVAALLAAIIAVVATLNIERGKLRREVDALRKSMAIELRQLIPRALAANKSIRRNVIDSITPITARMVESLAGARAPLVYLANVGRIGTLEGEAMDVVIVYSLLESARESIRLMGASRDPNNIDSTIVLQTAAIFLEACKYARTVLPKLRTGVPAHDDRDAELIALINAAVIAADKGETLPAS